MSVLYAIRSTLISAFTQLPLLLIGFVGLLGIGLGNLGLFILFLGHAVLLPIAVPLFQLVTSRLFGEGNPRFFVRASDIGRLVPSAPSVDYYQNVAPSYWITHIWFFFTYLFTNAAKIYKIEKNPKADQALYNNRLGRAILLMTVASISVVAATVLRYMMGTETVAGILISAGLAVGLGYGWYEFAAFCGARHADIFGIAQQILSPEAAAKKGPMTCVYTAQP